MKNATVLATLDATVLRFATALTTDDQHYIELVLDMRVAPPIPTFRAWLPLSPKSIAELAVMGVTTPPGLLDGIAVLAPADLADVFHHDRSRVFLIDLVSVACSNEESHGAEAQRLFVRNPRPAPDHNPKKE